MLTSLQEAGDGGGVFKRQLSVPRCFKSILYFYIPLCLSHESLHFCLPCCLRQPISNSQTLPIGTPGLTGVCSFDPTTARIHPLVLQAKMNSVDMTRACNYCGGNFFTCICGRYFDNDHPTDEAPAINGQPVDYNDSVPACAGPGVGDSISFSGREYSSDNEFSVEQEYEDPELQNDASSQNFNINADNHQFISPDVLMMSNANTAQYNSRNAAQLMGMPPANCGMDQVFGGIGSNMQFNFTDMNPQGGIGLDFTQENADASNAMNMRGDCVSADGFIPTIITSQNPSQLEFSNGGMGIPGNINITGNNGIFSNMGNAGNEVDFNNSGDLGPPHFEPISAQDDFGSSDITFNGQTTDQSAFSDFNNFNASTGFPPSRSLSATQPLHQPQMRATHKDKHLDKPPRIYAQEQRSAQGHQPTQAPSALSSSAVVTPTSIRQLSANQLGKQPVQQCSSSCPTGPTPSKKRIRPADIQIPSEPPKCARVDSSVSEPFASEVEADAARGRAIEALFKTPWAEMTQIEKARILMPVMIDKHPVEFEKEEKQHGLFYGTMRQREALQKTMRLRDEVIAEAHTKAQAQTQVTAVPTMLSFPHAMGLDERIDFLKEHLAEAEAVKKAEIAQEKREKANTKRAATVRRKRQEKKEAEQARREQEAEEAARQEAEHVARSQAYLDAQQFRVAEEQRRLAEEQNRRDEPYAQMGFVRAQPYGA